MRQNYSFLVAARKFIKATHLYPFISGSTSVMAARYSTNGSLRQWTHAQTVIVDLVL